MSFKVEVETPKAIKAFFKYPSDGIPKSVWIPKSVMKDFGIDDSHESKGSAYIPDWFINQKEL